MDKFVSNILEITSEKAVVNININYEKDNLN